MGNALTELRIHGDTAVRPYGDIFGMSGFTEAVDPSPLGEIAREAFASEIEAARRTGNLGYMARVLAQVTLPHSRPEGNEYDNAMFAHRGTPCTSPTNASKSSPRGEVHGIPCSTCYAVTLVRSRRELPGRIFGLCGNVSR